jgi:hypothetical protein
MCSMARMSSPGLHAASRICSREWRSSGSFRRRDGQTAHGPNNASAEQRSCRRARLPKGAAAEERGCRRARLPKSAAAEERSCRRARLPRSAAAEERSCPTAQGPDRARGATAQCAALRQKAVARLDSQPFNNDVSIFTIVISRFRSRQNVPCVMRLDAKLARRWRIVSSASARDTRSD